MQVMLASEIWAAAMGTKCEGTERCHWCTAPCKRLWLHDDPPPVPFVRSKSTSLHPSGNFVCVGCWLYRRNRTTVRFLKGGLKDCKAPRNYSWFVTSKDAWVIEKDDGKLLFERLLNPSDPFFLSILSENENNLIQLAKPNIPDQTRNDLSEYQFTFDGVNHTYTTYELESVLRSGNPEGVEPGVRTLINFFGVPENMFPPVPELVVAGKGRPSKDNPKPKIPNRKSLT